MDRLSCFMFILLPAPGYRNDSNGQLNNQTTYGVYWMLSASAAATARRFNFSAGAPDTTDSNYVGFGFSLRCIKI